MYRFEWLLAMAQMMTTKDNISLFFSVTVQMDIE